MHYRRIAVLLRLSCCRFRRHGARPVRIHLRVCRIKEVTRKHDRQDDQGVPGSQEEGDTGHGGARGRSVDQLLRSHVDLGSTMRAARSTLDGRERFVRLFQTMLRPRRWRGPPLWTSRRRSRATQNSRMWIAMRGRCGLRLTRRRWRYRLNPSGPRPADMGATVYEAFTV